MKAQITFQKVLRDIQTGQIAPVYLIVGEEPFQTTEILEALKARLFKDESSREFNYESWEGDHLDGKALVRSLETLPGLFDDPDTIRLVVCSRFDKAGSAAVADVEEYLASPAESTCFVLQCAKADKRKAWAKRAEKAGVRLEVSDPYDRDWPKWQGYFEKKIKKTFASEAWQLLVDGSGRSLGVLWAELQKLGTYLGSRKTVEVTDVLEVISGAGAVNVFEFVDDVLCRRRHAAYRKYHELLRSGENEIKLLSLLLRQYRIVDQALRLTAEGITDNRVLGGRLGVHPFFVPQVLQQARCQDPGAVNQALVHLAECDFRMKVGEGGLFEGFLLCELA